MVSKMLANGENASASLRAEKEEKKNPLWVTQKEIDEEKQRAMEERNKSCPALSCAVRADLYHSVYDLSIAEYGLVYLVVTLAAAALLTLAYKNVEQSTRNL